MAVIREPPPSTAERLLEQKREIAAGNGLTATRRWLWEWIRSILFALVLFLLIRTFLVEAFRIPTASMENTLLVGDFLLVNKAIYGARIPFTPWRLPAFDRPGRGDIVVFTPPHEPGRNYVKRLIALPGDTVEMLDKVIFINGVPQDEAFVRHGDPRDTYSPRMEWQCEFVVARHGDDGCRPSRDSWGPLAVPPGRALVLGDNRDDSEDSRYWGYVRTDAIKGRPLIVYYSFDPGSRPLPWLTRIRWSRIGETVH